MIKLKHYVERQLLSLWISDKFNFTSMSLNGRRKGGAKSSATKPKRLKDCVQLVILIFDVLNLEFQMFINVGMRLADELSSALNT